jgi:hypothetical protein
MVSVGNARRKVEANLSDVDLLNLQIVQDICHRLKGNKFPSANILLTLQHMEQINY